MKLMDDDREYLFSLDRIYGDQGYEDVYESGLRAGIERVARSCRCENMHCVHPELCENAIRKLLEE